MLFRISVLLKNLKGVRAKNAGGGSRRGLSRWGCAGGG